MRPMRAIRSRNYDERGDCRGCGRTLGWGTLPPKTSEVYQQIERHCRRNSGIVPTQSALSKLMSVTRATMGGHFDVLVEGGYLSHPSKGQYELLRHSAAEAIRKVECEVSSLQVKLDVLEQQNQGKADNRALVKQYEATLRKQVAMIRALEEKLQGYEPESREVRREQTHEKIQHQAQQAAQAGTVAPRGPEALEGQDELP